MGFLKCSFSPPVWLLRKSILGKHFFILFYSATEWALKYHGPTGPMEPAGPSRAGPGPEKKIHLVNGPGPSMEKPGPLSFLSPVLVSHIFRGIYKI